MFLHVALNVCTLGSRIQWGKGGNSYNHICMVLGEDMVLCKRVVVSPCIHYFMRMKHYKKQDGKRCITADVEVIWEIILYQQSVSIHISV